MDIIERTDQFRRTLVLLAITAFSILVFLCLPGRKVWNHLLISFPWLALFCGVAAAPWVERIAARVPPRILQGLLPALAIVAWILVPTVLGPSYSRNPCVMSQEFGTYFDELNPGEQVVMVSKRPSWRNIASLAAERRLVPIIGRKLPAAELVARSRIALVHVDARPKKTEGWRLVDSARGWILYLKTDPQ